MSSLTLPSLGATIFMAPDHAIQTWANGPIFKCEGCAKPYPVRKLAIVNMPERIENNQVVLAHKGILCTETCTHGANKATLEDLKKVCDSQ